MKHRESLSIRIITIILIALILSPLPSEWSSGLMKLHTDHNPVEVSSVHTLNETETFSIEPPTVPLNRWTITDSAPTPAMAQGVLDPTVVEQRGYSSTGNESGRTDTSANTQQSISIDTSHDWVGSQIQVDVWNVERLYVVNGTFDDGYPGYTVNPNGTLSNYPLGWSAISASGDSGQIQQVSYEQSSEQYVAVQNVAKLTNQGQNEYTHYSGTRVLWYQIFDNLPYSSDFLLSYKYLLLQGPLSTLFSGKFSLKVFINGNPVQSTNLPNLSSRGVWFDTGKIPISFAASGSIDFKIGLVMDATFVVDSDLDYDGDGFPDGIVNTQYITACLDDVSLVSTASPDCEDVSLNFSVNNILTSIIGDSGTGSGLLMNESYWTESELSIEINANTSISFDYNIRLLNHRFLSSRPTMSTSQSGVTYSIFAHQSGLLEMFTYFGIIGLYDDLTLRVYHPRDWQNFTVLDPFLADVTLFCSMVDNYIEVPTALLDRLGWWKILCQSPNYASDAVVERFDSGAMTWANETVFHSDDIARMHITLGANDDIPIVSDYVNFTWTMPDYSAWYESSTISGLIGMAQSSAITFGAQNTTAGIWCAVFHWSNGSEVGYGHVEFALHHQAVLELVFSDSLDTVVGQPITMFLRFYDIENGQFLISEGAKVVGTWAAGIVEFEPNVVKNWWEADFDTALVGAGNFNVSLTSTAPYFETAPFVVTIKSRFLTSLNVPNGPLEPLIYGRQYSFHYTYSMDYNSSGVDGASVQIIGDGSDWATVENTGDGHYDLSLIPLGLREHSIYLTFSKVGYENQSHVLSFLVTRVPMSVNLLTSIAGPERQLFEIEIEVVEADTENPVANANVSLLIMSKAGTLYASEEMIETSLGVYSSSIIMPLAGELTYDAIIIVEKQNHELTQEFRVPLIPTFDANARLVQTIVDYSLQIFLFAGLIAAVVTGQRFHSRRMRRKRALARGIRERFEDANNLLGVIVLHKLSGIPIYSRMFKSGFEEGLLSAFVSAIMHFRAEFDKGGEKDNYIVIPISDIIRVVPTPNLICAFITLTSASKVQEERMISYTRAIGMMFDETLEERPTQVADIKTIKTLEWLFDDFVDGILLRDYQIGEKKLPKKIRCIEEIVNKTDGIESFKLANLVLLLESCGVDEDDAYLIVMDAVENEYILPFYDKRNSPNIDPSVV